MEFPRNLELSDRECANEGDLPLTFPVTPEKNPSISAFKRLGKEDQEFKVSLDYSPTPFLSKLAETEGLRRWLSGRALAF